MRTDRRTDEANSHFSQFCERAQKLGQFLYVGNSGTLVLSARSPFKALTLSTSSRTCEGEEH